MGRPCVSLTDQEHFDCTLSISHLEKYPPMDQSVATIPLWNNRRSGFEIQSLTVFISVALFLIIRLYNKIVVILLECYDASLYCIEDTIYGRTMSRRIGIDSLNT